MMTKTILIKILSLISSIFAIFVNFLAVALPLNNRSTGAISDSFNAALIPASYVFSIWGLIYLGLIAFPVYQIFLRKNEDFSKVNIYFILSNLANALWIVLWHYGHYTWCLLVMLILLGTLIASYVKLEIGKKQVDTLQVIMVHGVFSLYLGWITVATVANAQATLITRGFDGFGIAPEIWATLLIAIIAALTFAFIKYRKDIIYTFVILWSLFGVFVRMDLNIVAYSALSAFILIALFLGYSVYNYKGSKA